MTTQRPYDEITGNLANDPKLTTIPAKTKPVRKFNAVIAGFEEKMVTTEEQNILKFGVVVNARDEEGNDVGEPIFFSVTDWSGKKCANLRKGDFVRLTGYARIEEKPWNGEDRTFYDFTVKTLPHVLFAKDRQPEEEEAA